MLLPHLYSENIIQPRSVNSGLNYNPGDYV